jgi:Spy/CpxP family protein refolding chaperone
LAKSEQAPWKVRISVIAMLVAVFSAGAVAGIAGYRWLWLDPRHANEPLPPGVLGARLRQLDLSKEQQAQARAIFEKYRPKLDAVLRETFPKVRAVQEQIDADLVKLLTNEQRRKFEELAKRHWHDHLGPPMGRGHGDGFHPRGPRPFEEPPPPPPGEPGLGGPALDMGSSSAVATATSNVEVAPQGSVPAVVSTTP